MSGYALRLTAQDNVATVLDDVAASEEVVVADAAGETVQTLPACTDIPRGHKIALMQLHPGMNVVKYGASLGLVTQEIPAGAHVHTHNLASARGRGDL